jgi:glutaminase
MGVNPEPPYVSTGKLPPPAWVRRLVADAHARYSSNAEGQVAQVYPALAKVEPELFGIAVVGTSGSLYAAGDADHQFTIMSVSKPFVFALVCQQLGSEEVREKLGVNSTGLPFDSLAAIERGGDGRTNPMVNAGAIAATSLVPGPTAEDRWEFLQDGLSRCAGRALALNAESTRPHRRPTTGTRASPAFCRATAESTATRPRRPICTRGSARST